MKKYTFEHGILFVMDDGTVDSYISTRTNLKYGFLRDHSFGNFAPSCDVCLPIRASCYNGRDILVTFNGCREVHGHPYPEKVTNSIELEQVFDAQCFALLHWSLKQGVRTHGGLMREFLANTKATVAGRVPLSTVFARFYEEFKSEFYNEAV